MKYFVQITAGLGIAAFLIGYLMKVKGVTLFLHGAPVAWWRASTFFLMLGVLYALIEIRDSLKK